MALFGGPGKLSGLLLRMGQCYFAAASIRVMVSAYGFFNSSAFCYLTASMGLQVLWSFGLACSEVKEKAAEPCLSEPICCW